MNQKENQFIHLYNQFWTDTFANGYDNQGDLEASLQFLRQLNIPTDSKILEIGCAIGKLCHELDKIGFTSVKGIDISETAIQCGQNKYPHLSLNSYNGICLDFPDNSFNICLSFDVVEHIPDIDNHFQDVVRILESSGKYIFQTPNILSNSVINTIIYKGRMTWKIYHPSLQSSFSLKRKLINAGFQKVEFVKISPLTEFKLAFLPFILQLVVKLVPWTWLPIWLQPNFFVIAYKNNSPNL
ncbi:methyltransferase [Beggiatoa sp. PS]|nr:methyltransferase [Beggiatoa sp. PS]